jgi:NADPH-dependent 2,4-dienoyl-CoA reductase/sulfur reductase-like enzyme/rhodanese-related sulfurtransferase
VPEGRQVVIVGASAAGMRCACRLARLDPACSIVVVETEPVFSYAACGLPYVLSGDIDDRDALRRTTYGTTRDASFFADVKGVTVHAGWRATHADSAARRLTIERGGERQELPWDELVLATGARARRLPHQPDHDRVHAFHRWDDVAPLKQGLARGQIGHVCVVGAGLVGCELAEAFRSLWGADVTLVESAPALLPQVLDAEVAAIVTRTLEEGGVRVLCGRGVRAIAADDEAAHVEMEGGTVSCDAVVVAVGVAPQVELAAELGVRLGPTGAVAVDAHLATTVPHVWAAGDCVEVQDVTTGQPAFRPLGSLANRQGRTLANVLAGRDEVFPPVAGAVAVKAFDLNVAAVGLTEDRARRAGLAFRCAWVTADDVAHYWPEAPVVHIKLLYEVETRRVLGVQAVGRGDVAKRIDTATQLMVRRATLLDLAHLEHAYAPPYAPAIDPLATAAFAALNQEDGIEAVSPAVSLGPVLDVRLPEESNRPPVDATAVTAVPLSELRARLPELGAVDTVVCVRGTRSSEAVRLLQVRGQRARYLAGGLLWRAAAGRRPPDKAEPE